LKKLSIITLLILFLLPVHVFAKPATVSAKKDSVSVEGQFKKSFPKSNFESISPTPLKGIYEVYAGNQVYYFIPKEEVIFAGPIVTKDGVNITSDSMMKKTAKKMAGLSLDSALKIGHGKNVVVEFMDPHCFHCREAFKFFSKRQDVTMNIIFLPLSKESAQTIKSILCAKDPAKMFDDIMSGKIDDKTPLSACTDKKVDETVKTHMKLASQVGVGGTPLFYIKGQVINGFDVSAIERLLKE
jgi:thiol:disulfide interchange protein DsbC